MSFIELRDTRGNPVTVNTKYIVSFRQASATGTDIQLNPGSPTGAARLLASVSYDNMRKLLELQEDVRGCSCGEADYGAPGHDGYMKEDDDGDEED